MKKIDHPKKEFGSFEKKLVSFENIDNFIEKIQFQCVLCHFRCLRPENFNMEITLKFN